MSKLWRKPQPLAFHALHVAYHERDVRVRVNDYTVEMLRRVLGLEAEWSTDDGTCPACSAGYSLKASEEAIPAAQ